MLDPRARQLTGLSKENYLYVMKNYTQLMHKYPKVKREVTEKIQYINSKLDVKDLCQNC